MQLSSSVFWRRRRKKGEEEEESLLLDPLVISRKRVQYNSVDIRVVSQRVSTPYVLFLTEPSLLNFCLLRVKGVARVGHLAKE